MAYSPMTIPTGQQQLARSQNVNAQNPAANQQPQPIAPSMPAVLQPGSQITSGVSQSQQALARPPGANTGVPLPQPAKQAPGSLAGIANTPPQMQTPNIQNMIQSLGAAKISQNPLMMQTILGMLGPQAQPPQPPPLGQLMQPQILRPQQPGLPMQRIQPNA